MQIILALLFDIRPKLPPAMASKHLANDPQIQSPTVQDTCLANALERRQNTRWQVLESLAE